MLQYERHGMNQTVALDSKINEPVHEKKKTIWVPTRSDINWAVQSQKMVRGWKFWI